MVGEEEMALPFTVLKVDDDNLPAPDNIPTGNEGDIFKDWQEVLFCYWKKEIFRNNKPRLNILADARPTRLQLLEIFFPMNFIWFSVIDKINSNIAGEPVTYGKFIQWIGCWLLTV